MSISLTMKQEAFCLAYMETMNASEAYRRAYNAGNMAEATIWRKANELVKNGKVTARIEELRQPVIEQAQLTLESHLNTLAALRDKAEAEGKYGPAIQAEISRGKAAGLYSDKIELTGKGGGPIATQNLNELTDEELLSIVVGRPVTTKELNRVTDAGLLAACTAHKGS